MRFCKMHGCGNDYIYINCFEETVTDPNALSREMSDRHFGIGSDGLILISPTDTADAYMRMFNADGSEGDMCGNAIRCMAKYLYESGTVPRTEMRIETMSGIRTLRLFTEGGKVVRAQVDMGKARYASTDIPVLLLARQVVDHPIRTSRGIFGVTCVSMGNPHAVIYVDSVEDFPVEEVGRQIETHSLFPERVNTEFIEVLSPEHLKMRVWERGSGETWACGTGACASVAASVLRGFCPKDRDVTVDLRGGTLLIRVTDETVWMTGECVEVFRGTVEA